MQTRKRHARAKYLAGPIWHPDPCKKLLQTGSHTPPPAIEPLGPPFPERAALLFGPHVWKRPARASACGPLEDLAACVTSSRVRSPKHLEVFQRQFRAFGKVPVTVLAQHALQLEFRPFFPAFTVAVGNQTTSPPRKPTVNQSLDFGPRCGPPPSPVSPF